MSGLSFSITSNPYRRNGKPTRDVRKSHHDTGTVDFVGVDGEGVTDPVTGEHRYVLLGVGDDQIEDPAGLHWRDIFPFLYSHHRPRVAFTGFYLGYDFTQWLKTLPEDRARALLTDEGKERRRSRSPKLKGKFLPVDVEDWQIDILGAKQLSIRHKPCDCGTMKCPHPKGPWLYVCDAGPFFQTSFLNVINPENWQEPIVTDEEYATIVAGKEARSSAVLDDDMRFYNRLENNVLARVMRDLNGGFRKLDVTLTCRQWYGPGQASQTWMRGRAPKTQEVIDAVPDWFLDAARQSYFGGWFEIAAHGIVPGVSHEYDINSAYPYVIASLPCLLHGVYSRGEGSPPPLAEGEICLVRALVWGDSPHSNYRRRRGLGAMLHRDKQGRISRPLITAGWYWLDELDAAVLAGCVKRVRKDRYYEWVKYTPCDCKPPLWQIANLYKMRLDVGKTSSLGKSAKLVANSSYGKLAQSVGQPVYANPVYASRITSGCRRIILQSIASHPGGKMNVLMVATDAVFFLDPHPMLPVSKVLGEWDYKARHNLTLFKPGVYWDDEAREQIAAGDHPSFKARGINARDFASSISAVDGAFRAWDGQPPPRLEESGMTYEQAQASGNLVWPKVTFSSNFAMVTALQALARKQWATAGHVDTGKPFVQSANPADKRRDVWLDRTDPARPIYRSEPLEVGENAVYRTVQNASLWESMAEETYDSVPYEKRFGLEDPWSELSLTEYGVNPDEQNMPFRGAFRVLTGRE